MPEPIAVTLDHRTVLKISGPEAEDFLQGLLTNDVSKASESRAIYAALLTPQGKFLHDLYILRRDGNFLVDCDAARKDDLIRRLTMYRLRSRVEIADIGDDWDVWALLPDGDDSPGSPGEAAAIDGGIRFVDPRNAGLGWRALMQAGAVPAGRTGRLADYDRRRIALGVPDGARDIAVEKTLILEANFDDLGGVDFQKGCYVGQELAARMKHRGRVRKRIYPLRIDGDGDVPEPGTPIEAEGKPVGEIHTGIDNLALATLRIDAVENNAPLKAAGRSLTVTAEDRE